MVIDRQKAMDVLHAIEHAMGHLKQSNLDDEGRHAMRPLESALHNLKHCLRADIVVASTGASWDDCSGNIIVGVTAHCRCGRSFCDDVRAAALNLKTKA